MERSGSRCVRRLTNRARLPSASWGRLRTCLRVREPIASYGVTAAAAKRNLAKLERGRERVEGKQQEEMEEERKSTGVAH